MKKIMCLAFLVSVLAAPAWAGVTQTQVSGNELTAQLAVAGVGAELTVSFEQVVGLSAANLGLSVAVADPTALVTRLPSSATSVAAGFPLLLTIEPPAAGGLSFSGVVTIELYTHDLAYVAHSPLRLFAAPLSGDFRDITEHTAGGSYRVRGNKGMFSEFLILADLRTVDSVIGIKYDRLEDLMVTHAADIEDGVETQLANLLSDSRDFYDGGNLVAAIRKIESFEKKVRQASSGDIPDVWRSARDLDNVAGMLRSAADTLRFSLTMKSNGAP